MVIKTEAYCPTCLNQDGYSVALNFHAGSGEFVCERNGDHVFVEDESGFLVSKKKDEGESLPWAKQ